MKRFLSILLAVAMTISMVLPVFAYTDTTGDDHEAAIAHLSGLGVINGYEDGSFQPDKVVTRAEMAKLLVVALKLDLGADLLTGESQFDDVATSHWAIGYINVATSYGLIKGDGDGNFRPDDTVSYAEASTMALRALNYTKVVEKDGVWPTNYLNKANELKLFDDVEGVKASEGAKRGEVAQILWNMLNTQMWEVVSENENNGLTSAADRKMMTVKFPDYTFAEDLIFADYKISEIKEKLEVELYFGTSAKGYIYNENDFYKFVAGTEFEAVIYDGEEIVTLFATEDNYLVEGAAKELNDKYDNAAVTEGKGVYAYLLLDGSRASAARIGILEYNSDNSIYVEEIKEYSNGFTFTDGVSAAPTSGKFDEEAVAETIVLIDGERKTLKDVKVGDVISFVDTGLAIVERGTVNEGEVTSYVDATDVMTVGGNKYYVAQNSTVIVEPDDEDSTAVAFTTVDVTDYEEEVAKVYTDFIGNIVRIEFAELTEEDKGEAGFYVIANDTWMISDENGAIYKIKLTDMAGNTVAYTFDEDKVMNITDSKNEVVWVEFNKDGEIESMTDVIHTFNSSTFIPTVVAGTYYNSKITTPDIDDKYVAEAFANISIKDSYLYESTTQKYKVSDSTKYVKLLFDVDEKTSDVTYKVEVETGAEGLKGINGAALVVYTGDFKNVSYVIAWDDTTTTDLMGGIVTNNETNKVTGDVEVTIKDAAGNEKEYVVASGAFVEGCLVAYVINDDGEVIQKEAARPIDFNGAGRVSKVEGRSILLTNGTIIDLDDKAYADVYEDAKVVVATVDYNAKSEYSFSNYEIVDFEETDYASIKVAKDSFVGLGVTGDVIVIYNLTTAAKNEAGL